MNNFILITVHIFITVCRFKCTVVCVQFKLCLTAKPTVDYILLVLADECGLRGYIARPLTPFKCFSEVQKSLVQWVASLYSTIGCSLKDTRGITYSTTLNKSNSCPISVWENKD